MGKKILQISLRMLTPLWTGGIVGKMDRVHATGIIGSLRWWFELIARGLGYEVCNVTENPCRKEHDNDVCEVCKVFGTTGWRRRFCLSVESSLTRSWEGQPPALNIRPPDRNRGWFLPPGEIGSITVTLHGDEKAVIQVAALFLFLERWGSIGAKPQLGYGFFRIENRDQIREQVIKYDIWNWEEQENNEKDMVMPGLHRFGFFRFRFQPGSKIWESEVPGIERLFGRGDTGQAIKQILKKNMVPVTPALRNVWRFEKWKGALGVKGCLFGTTEGRGGTQLERIRSKIAVSWAYEQQRDWEIRGWVWLPEYDHHKNKIPYSMLQNLWQIIGNESIWKKTLKIRSGSLSLCPQSNVFRAFSPSQAKQFINGTII